MRVNIDRKWKYISFGLFVTTAIHIGTCWMLFAEKLIQTVYLQQERKCDPIVCSFGLGIFCLNLRNLIQSCSYCWFLFFSKLATVCRPGEECCHIYEKEYRKRKLVIAPDGSENNLLLRHWINALGFRRIRTKSEWMILIYSTPVFDMIQAMYARKCSHGKEHSQSVTSWSSPAFFFQCTLLLRLACLRRADSS